MSEAIAIATFFLAAFGYFLHLAAKAPLDDDESYTSGPFRSDLGHDAGDRPAAVDHR